MRYFTQWLDSPTAMARFHLWATLFWLLAIIPTVLWWRDSILWVIVISLWANVASHWACYQAAKAEKKVDQAALDAEKRSG